MNSEEPKPRRRSLKIAIAALCVLAGLIFVRPGKETITFKIVNAKTGESVTNVNVIAYRPVNPLFERVLKFFNLSSERDQRVPVTSTGLAKVSGPGRGSFVMVYFDSDEDFFPEVFTRTFGGAGLIDSFGTLPQMDGEVPTTNPIKISLYPRNRVVKP